MKPGLSTLAILVTALAACSSNNDDGSGGGAATGSHTGTGTGTGGAFEPPPDSLTVKFGPIDVDAGVEKTQCVTKRLGNAGAIHVGEIHNELIGVSHHMIVY